MRCGGVVLVMPQPRFPTARWRRRRGRGACRSASRRGFGFSDTQGRGSLDYAYCQKISHRSGQLLEDEEELADEEEPVEGDVLVDKVGWGIPDFTEEAEEN